MYKVDTLLGRGSRRALITGGAGFIGSHLSEVLLERGYQVTVLDDLSIGRADNIAHLADDPRFCFVEGSILDQAALEPLVANCDVLLHLAASLGVRRIIDDPLGSMETNVLGTHTVLKLAGHYRPRVLIASTSEVYGKSLRERFHEDDDQILGPTTKARWSYASSKALDEFLGLAYHRQTGLPVVIFRLFNTVGPRQTGRYGMVVPNLIQQAQAGELLTVFGDGQQSRCFCDVEDVVGAIVGLAQSDEAVGKVFNIGSDHEVTILGLAKKVLEAVDATSPPLVERRFEDRVRLVPYQEAYGDGFEDMRRRRPDTSRIRDVIGWEPKVSLEETLSRVCASLGRRVPETLVAAR